MTAEKIIELFERMRDEGWKYTMGAAEEGNVDCSGAFVYAYRVLDGLSIYHGSNWMARNEAGELLPISKARAGMIAFKARQEDEQGYHLPDKYKSGNDLTDYYHVGLVDTDGRVLNAAGEDYGFISSALTAKNGWDYVAYGKHIDYGETKETEEEGETMTDKTVTATSGSTVNLRASASKKAALIDRVPVGAMVQVISESGEWSLVKYDGMTGYIMSEFLTGNDTTSTGENEMAISELYQCVCELQEQYTKLAERIQALEGGVG